MRDSYSRSGKDVALIIAGKGRIIFALILDVGETMTWDQGNWLAALNFDGPAAVEAHAWHPHQWEGIAELLRATHACNPVEWRSHNVRQASPRKPRRPLTKLRKP